MQHLVLYDGECGVCDTAVQFILQRDHAEIFAFAPLQGKTAAELMKRLPQQERSADTIFLIENFQSIEPRLSIRGKAIFRICWLLGGGLAAMGCLAFLPAWLYDWAYRLFAKWRYRLMPQRCLLPTVEQRRRFLP